VELPRLEQLWNGYREKGFSVVAVEARQDRERAEKFIEENQLTYIFVEDLEGDDEIVENIFGIGGFPTTYIIDRKGKVLFAHLGFSEGDEVKLEEEIKQLL
jgi:peroxiredoxin